MLTKVSVVGLAGVLELPLLGEDVAETPLSEQSLQLRNVTGLGPVTATVNTTPFGSVDGESYAGSSIGKRNIVLTVGLNPNWASQTMFTLRQELYAWFMTKQTLSLKFDTDDLPVLEIAGYVESCEPNIFSKDPEMQVSIICPLPDFMAYVGGIGSGTVGTSLDDNDPVNNYGTMPSGLILSIAPTDDNPSYSGDITIAVLDYPGELTVHDVLVDNLNLFRMSSVRGDKYVRREEFGEDPVSLLRALEPGYMWPLIYPGVNYVSVYASEPGQAYSLSYIPRYGGL